MSRGRRIQYENAIYHVINRGDRRWDVFASDRTKDAFEACVFEACILAQWVLHAFVVMRNHFHLAIETPRANLSEGMHWLETTFAVRFNRFHSESGHIFQGRFQGILVEPGPSLLRVVDYIHLNPVRAKLVSVAQLNSYRWASFRRFRGGIRPASLQCAWLKELGLSDHSPGWTSYENYLQLRVGGAQEQAADRKELTRGWAIGSPPWKKEIALKYRPLLGRHRLKAGELKELKEIEWANRLESLLRATGYSRAEATQSPKGEPWKIQLAWSLRHTTSATNRWIAAQLHMGSANSVSNYLSRLRTGKACLIRANDALEHT